MTVAAMLLAAAFLLGGETSRARAGLRAPMPTRRRVVRDADPLAAASTLEVLAACLRSGMAVSTAAAATALSAPPHLARVLTRAETTMPRRCCALRGGQHRREPRWH